MKLVNFKVLAGTTVLSGASRGADMLARLVRLVNPEPTNPQAMFLDFSNIDVATASYLRESVFAFRDFVRGKRSMLYPVIANANDDVREEFLALTASGAGSIMSCTLSPEGKVSEPALIGTLDPKQQ